MTDNDDDVDADGDGRESKRLHVENFFVFKYSTIFIFTNYRSEIGINEISSNWKFVIIKANSEEKNFTLHSNIHQFSDIECEEARHLAPSIRVPYGIFMDLIIQIAATFSSFALALDLVYTIWSPLRTLHTFRVKFYINIQISPFLFYHKLILSYWFHSF